MSQSCTTRLLPLEDALSVLDISESRFRMEQDSVVLVQGALTCEDLYQRCIEELGAPFHEATGIIIDGDLEVERIQIDQDLWVRGDTNAGALLCDENEVFLEDARFRYFLSMLWRDGGIQATSVRTPYAINAVGHLPASTLSGALHINNTNHFPDPAYDFDQRNLQTAFVAEVLGKSGLIDIKKLFERMKTGQPVRRNE